ncbi:MAG: helix-turn-helix domain-containing protein [Lachnospiraceae bacterium]|nr:helix-turn-helix domain-containing protein [Lachnospiraceae bacterium]
MKDRIKIVRKDARLTQKEFAERLGVKQNTVACYEMGKSGLSDSVIISICREFNVREEWLRDGVEPRYKSRTRNQEIGSFMNDVMDLPDEAFKKRLIDALRKLDEKDWEAIERIADRVLKEG